MRSTKPIRSGDGSRSLPLVTAGPEGRGRFSIYAKSRVRCEWFRPQPPSTLAGPISFRPRRWVKTSPSKTSRHTCLPPRSRLWMSSSGGPTRRWRRKPLKLHIGGTRTTARVRPGGSAVIVDHAAAAGTGTSDAQSLHRIDPVSVREEVEAAGFVLDAESAMLANKDDPHSIKVFDPSIKGETDRFAYRFVKP